MVSEKIVPVTKNTTKRTKNVLLQVDGEPDAKKPKLLGDDYSWNMVDCDKDARAAMIRSRFAETILKFQQKLLFNQSNEIVDKKLVEKKKKKKKKAIVEAKTSVSKLELKKFTMHKDSRNRVDCGKDTCPRAMMIRSRFAETILKSQQKLRCNQSNEAEKKMLMVNKKANLDDKIRASKELKMKKIQKEREAARLAISNIQRTVEWNDAWQITMEYQKLIGVPTITTLVDNGH